MAWKHGDVFRSVRGGLGSCMAWKHGDVIRSVRGGLGSCMAWKHGDVFRSVRGGLGSCMAWKHGDVFRSVRGGLGSCMAWKHGDVFRSVRGGLGSCMAWKHGDVFRSMHTCQLSVNIWMYRLASVWVQILFLQVESFCNYFYWQREISTLKKKHLQQWSRKVAKLTGLLLTEVLTCNHFDSLKCQHW